MTTTLMNELSTIDLSHVYFHKTLGINVQITGNQATKANRLRIAQAIITKHANNVDQAILAPALANQTCAATHIARSLHEMLFSFLITPEPKAPCWEDEVQEGEEEAWKAAQKAHLKWREKCDQHYQATVKAVEIMNSNPDMTATEALVLTTLYIL